MLPRWRSKPIWLTPQEHQPIKDWVESINLKTILSTTSLILVFDYCLFGNKMVKSVTNIEWSSRFCHQTMSTTSMTLSVTTHYLKTIQRQYWLYQIFHGHWHNLKTGLQMIILSRALCKIARSLDSKRFSVKSQWILT